MVDGPETEERPSEQRIREAQTLGALDYFLVSCPKDLAMYADAAKAPAVRPTAWPDPGLLRFEIEEP